jgi:hypothetical protein
VVYCISPPPPETIDKVAFGVDLGFTVKKNTGQTLMWYLFEAVFAKKKMENNTGWTVLQYMLEMLLAQHNDAIRAHAS